MITTRNEEKNIARCLQSVSDFDDVIIVDSNSTDRTVQISQKHNVTIKMYQWDGAYPKKRQWCLDNIQTKYDYILFLDADEVLTAEFIEELNNISLNKPGYFVKGAYVWEGRPLRHGLINNKLALIDKNKIEFPVVDDLTIEGIGEIEGHYQPVLKEPYKGAALGQIRSPIIHYAYDSPTQWQQRHERYANWEAQMIERHAYPKDPKAWREFLKRIFRVIPFRSGAAFIHSYLIKMGFLDGKAGYDFAMSRKCYYQMVSQARKENRFKNQ